MAENAKVSLTKQCSLKTKLTKKILKDILVKHSALPYKQQVSSACQVPIFNYIFKQLGIKNIDYTTEDWENEMSKGRNYTLKIGSKIFATGEFEKNHIYQIKDWSTWSATNREDTFHCLDLAKNFDKFYGYIMGFINDFEGTNCVQKNRNN